MNIKINISRNFSIFVLFVFCFDAKNTVFSMQSEKNSSEFRKSITDLIEAAEKNESRSTISLEKQEEWTERSIQNLLSDSSFVLQNEEIEKLLSRLSSFEESKTFNPLLLQFLKNSNFDFLENELCFENEFPWFVLVISQFLKSRTEHLNLEETVELFENFGKLFKKLEKKHSVNLLVRHFEAIYEKISAVFFNLIEKPSTTETNELSYLKALDFFKNHILWRKTPKSALLSFIFNGLESGKFKPYWNNLVNLLSYTAKLGITPPGVLINQLNKSLQLLPSLRKPQNTISKEINIISLEEISLSSLIQIVYAGALIELPWDVLIHDSFQEIHKKIKSGFFPRQKEAHALFLSSQWYYLKNSDKNLLNLIQILKKSYEQIWKGAPKKTSFLQKKFKDFFEELVFRRRQMNRLITEHWNEITASPFDFFIQDSHWGPLWIQIDGPSHFLNQNTFNPKTNLQQKLCEKTHSICLRFSYHESYSTSLFFEKLRQSPFFQASQFNSEEFEKEIKKTDSREQQEKNEIPLSYEESLFLKTKSLYFGDENTFQNKGQALILLDQLLKKNPKNKDYLYLKLNIIYKQKNRNQIQRTDFHKKILVPMFSDLISEKITIKHIALGIKFTLDTQKKPELAKEIFNSQKLEQIKRFLDQVSLKFIKKEIQKEIYKEHTHQESLEIMSRLFFGFCFGVPALNIKQNIPLAKEILNEIINFKNQEGFLLFLILGFINIYDEKNNKDLHLNFLDSFEKITKEILPEFAPLYVKMLLDLDPKPIEKILYWSTIAAEQGNGESMERLGKLYNEEKYNLNNPELALEWYEKAAALEIPNSLYMAGSILCSLERDLPKAKTYLLKAARAYPAKSFLTLGHIVLMEGNISLSLAFFEKSIDSLEKNPIAPEISENIRTNMLFSLQQIGILLQKNTDLKLTQQWIKLWDKIQ